MVEFKLSIEEINLVLKGLLELPAKDSMKLILKVEQEARKKLNELDKDIKK